MPRMRAFLLSFFLTAGILAPLVLFLLLLQGRQQQRQAQVDAPASGVPIALPGPDDALTGCLAAARRVPFGEEPVIGYLYAREQELTAIRSIFAGRAAGLDGETIRSRLRRTYV